MLNLSADAQKVGPQCLDLLINSFIKSSPGLFQVCVIAPKVKYCQFGCGRGGRRSQVGDKVGDDCVGLVPYGGYDGNRAVKYCFCDAFLIEGPEVFEGSSSPANNNDVHFFCFQRPDPADNAVRGRFSLNDGRVQDNLNIGIAPSCNLNDITDSRTGGGGDNTQAPDKGRNGLFIGRIEHSLLQELLFQLFKAFGQCANAVTDDLVGVELVASCLCVYIHGAGNNDLITVLHVKRKPPSTACEHDAGQRPGGIF